MSDHHLIPASVLAAAVDGPVGAVATVVFVGAGPRTTSLLERLAANAPELLVAGSVQVHVVDPYPAGGGRIWRRAQSPLLWMNSVAADVTMFTDDSVQCAGPHRLGPTLAEWVPGEGRDILLANGLADVVETFRSTDFPSREVQSHYLAWVFDQAVKELPDSVRVQVHLQRAVRVSDVDSGRQLVILADGTEMLADVVVLAQGYLDREPTAAEGRIASSAAAAGLTYLGPSYTADLDLSDIRPGDDVLVRGMGLAFIDLMVLLTEARGGTFTTAPDGTLSYHRSGREPVLHVGSRRGIPYHSKLGYVNFGAPPLKPHYFTPQALDQIFQASGSLDYHQKLFPLLVKELCHAHYEDLYRAHPERARGTWDDFSRLIADTDPRSAEFLARAAEFVPSEKDRFDLATIDRPLRNEIFTSREALTERIRDYTAGDLARRADPAYSQDLAVFNALLAVYGVIGQAIAQGRISAADRVQRIEGELHGLFSFLASGPPPQRLSQFLALLEAGVVTVIGPDMKVEIVDGSFSGSSPAVAGDVRAAAFIEARLPRPDVPTALDPVIRNLLTTGDLAVERIATGQAAEAVAGQLLADERCRARDAKGHSHPRRFLLGPSVSGSAGASGFSRPHYNSPFLRQNDAVAREIVALVNQSAQTLRADTINNDRITNERIVSERITSDRTLNLAQENYAEQTSLAS